MSQSGKVRSSKGERRSSVEARAPLAERVVTFLRRDNPLSWRTKTLVQALFRAEAPPSPIYRVLAAERFLRMVIGRHVLRAAYHQPIFR
ncbi:MAG TPA: hypothetical protein VGH63_17405, partial [Polyangia bacterium]